MAEDQILDEDNRVSTLSGRYQSSRYPGFYGAQSSPSTDNVIQGTPQTSPQSVVSGEADMPNTIGSGDTAGSSALNSIYADTPRPKMPEAPSMGDAAVGLGKAALGGAATTFGAGAGAAIASGSGFGSALQAGASEVTGTLGSLASQAGLASGITGGAAPAAGGGLSSATSQAATSAQPFSAASGAGAAIGAGIGSAVIGLALGQDPKEAAASGVGTAIGYAVGGPIGGAIGSVIGSVVGGGSVICTELVRNGKMDWNLYLSDVMYGRYLPRNTIEGYHKWAIPIVKLMRKYEFVSDFFAVFANWRAKEAQHRLDMKMCGGWHDKLAWVNGGDIRGKAIRIVFEPICYVIGMIVSDQDFSVLYEGA